MGDTAYTQLLIERIATLADQNAYKELFRTYYKPLSQFADSILRNKESAEEVASDVFLNVWKNRERLLQITNVKVYLYVSTKNTALNYLAREQKTKHFSLDDLSVEVSLSDISPEELLISREMMRKLQSAVNSLPPKRKLIYKLIREDGLRYKEVAQILDISVNTIDVHMANATKHIVKCMTLTINNL